MKIKILLVVVSTTWVMGQNPKQGNIRIMVKGSVYDKDDQSPVMQATVQLLSLPDSTMVTGNVTDEKGTFSLSARTGKYVLKVSFIGYLTATIWHTQYAPQTPKKGRTSASWPWVHTTVGTMHR